MDNLVGYKPTRKVKISLYKYRLAVILRWLRAKGVNVKVLDEINLGNIERHSYQTPQLVRPNIFSHNKVYGHLTGEDITEVLALTKAVSDIDAFLYLVNDLAYNETTEEFRFISPVKLYTNQEKTDFTWIFCYVRKISGKVYLEINGLPDKEFPTPVFPGDWKIIGFSYPYFSEKVEKDLPVVKAA